MRLHEDPFGTGVGNGQQRLGSSVDGEGGGKRDGPNGSTTTMVNGDMVNGYR